MLFTESRTEIKAFVEKLNNFISKHQPGSQLSLAQRAWLSFCLTGILMTNSVCWAKFERASLGTDEVKAMSWMFRYSGIPWESLLQSSVILILEEYGITEGVLVVDESDKKRSKSAKKIHHLHKLLDKTSGGYVSVQTVVLLLLVTQKITLPVGFAFYMPDPLLSAWYKENKKLKKAGNANRPKKPEANPNYPTKQQLALTLLKQFKNYYKEFMVKVIVADALY